MDLGALAGIGGISEKIRVHVQFDLENDLAIQKSRLCPLKGAPEGPRYQTHLKSQWMLGHKTWGQQMGGYFEIWHQPGILH